MKNRITILIGVSGSGKSTWAHQQWEQDPNNVIVVNRDKIRELLFSFTEDSVKNYYKRDDVFSKEKIITRYEDTIINEALESGKDVIVDATHLKRGYIERFKYWNVPTGYKMFPITHKEAEIRDMSRKRNVGAEVIKRQMNQFRQLFTTLTKNPIDFSAAEVGNVRRPDKPDCVIFDIDGTVAIKGGRSPYDWKRVGEDKLERDTASIADYISSCEEPRPKIIICTGRDGICLYETERWMKSVGLPYDEVYIRPQGDSRPDWVVKEEMWRKIAKDNYIVGMFDDRLQVVRRARSLGLKVFNVEYNNF